MQEVVSREETEVVGVGGVALQALLGLPQFDVRARGVTEAAQERGDFGEVAGAGCVLGVVTVQGLEAEEVPSGGLDAPAERGATPARKGAVAASLRWVQARGWSARRPLMCQAPVAEVTRAAISLLKPSVASTTVSRGPVCRSTAARAAAGSRSRPMRVVAMGITLPRCSGAGASDGRAPRSPRGGCPAG